MMYSIVQIILSVLIFILASGILILLGLFYDHRRKPELALKYILGFFIFVGVGLLLVFNYYMFVVILAPIFIWSYFFLMFINSNARKKKLDSQDVID